MKILVRLPDWIGDITMSSAFFTKLKELYPEATVDVVVREKMQNIIPFIQGIDKIYLINQENYSGIKRKFRFAKAISKTKQYDLFFTLSNSFSSAFLGFFSGSKKRIGYKSNFREIFLSDSYSKPTDIHRVDEFLLLLKLYFNKNLGFSSSSRTSLDIGASNFEQLFELPAEYIFYNGTSEASSRSIPLEMSVQLIEKLYEEFKLPIVFAGSNPHQEYYFNLLKNLNNPSYCINLTGQASLHSLIHIMKGANLIISTDSGPAQLANALDQKLMVLFGAGNEFSTGPYNKNNAQIMRTQLECTPCVSNRCQFGVPKCLLALDVETIVKRSRSLMEREFIQVDL